jgi:dGTPase
MSWYARKENWNPQFDDAREAGDVDYARVIHSASFRRLQGKTQILNLGDSDFYRTRLTHSLEVAQIASGIVRQFARHFSEHPAASILPDGNMIQAIGLTHDLGHPPFGHGGEIALNYCMRGDAGGFEGNGQTLRILSKLEKFSDKAGSNMTRRTLLGVLKYPVPYQKAYNPKLVPALQDRPTAIQIIDRKASKPPKCYLDCEKDVVDWILDPLSDNDRSLFQSFSVEETKHHKAKFKSFDCSIMDLADDIGFGVHDLEDALALRLITEEQFRRIVTEEAAASFLNALKEKYPAEFGNDVYGILIQKLFGEGRIRKRFIGRMVHHLITNVRIETLDQFEEPLIRYKAVLTGQPALFLAALKKVVMQAVILSAGVQHLEFKGQKMVVSVFEALSSEPDQFLALDTYELYKNSADPTRVICDHIAGMTDSFLLRTYERLFSPRMGSVFDKL